MSIHRQGIGSRDIANLPGCHRHCLDAVTNDLSWATAAESRWGCCGVAALMDDEVAGYGLIAPAWHFDASVHPHALDSPHEPAGSRASAVLLASWVVPGNYPLDIRRVVVEGLIATLMASGDVALDATATRWKPTCLHPSVRSLADVGFRITQENIVLPVMRLRVDRAVTDRPVEGGGMWRRITRTFRRPDLPPAPAQRRPSPPWGQSGTS